MRKADALAAVLVACDLRDDLRRDIAGRGEAVRLLDQRAGDDRAVLQHILEVYEVAVMHVLRKIIAVVEVDDSLLVRLDDLLRQQDAARDVLRDLAGHVVALDAVDRRVFIRVLLLRLLVVALDQAEDLVVGRVGAARERTGVAIADVALRDLERVPAHDLVFNHVLNLLDGGRAAHRAALLLHLGGDRADLLAGQLPALPIGVVGLRDGGDDLRNIESGLRAVSLDDFHSSFLLRPVLSEFLSLLHNYPIIQYLVYFPAHTRREHLPVYTNGRRLSRLF